MVVTLRLSLNYRSLLLNSVIQVYKFEPIFKKIGQTKAFIYLSREFLLCCFLTFKRWKWKTNTSLSGHRTVGLSGCRTI